MSVLVCPNCGGTHYGSHKCPYTKGVCVICGEETVFACADCRIDTGMTINVCSSTDCRDRHEAATHPSTNREKGQQP